MGLQERKLEQRKQQRMREIPQRYIKVQASEIHKFYELRQYLLIEATTVSTVNKLLPMSLDSILGERERERERGREKEREGERRNN